MVFKILTFNYILLQSTFFIHLFLHHFLIQNPESSHLLSKISFIIQNHPFIIQNHPFIIQNLIFYPEESPIYYPKSPIYYPESSHLLIFLHYLLHPSCNCPKNTPSQSLQPSPSTSNATPWDGPSVKPEENFSTNNS